MLFLYSNQISQDTPSKPVVAQVMSKQEPSYEQLKQENERLKAQLFQQQQRQPQQHLSQREQKFPLSLDEYARYGRQMIVPQFGIEGRLF